MTVAALNAYGMRFPCFTSPAASISAHLPGQATPMPPLGWLFSTSLSGSGPPAGGSTGSGLARLLGRKSPLEDPEFPIALQGENQLVISQPLSGEQGKSLVAHLRREGRGFFVNIDARHIEPAAKQQLLPFWEIPYTAVGCLISGEEIPREWRRVLSPDELSPSLDIAEGSFDDAWDEVSVGFESSL